MSKESKKRISEKLLGRNISLETRNKISKGLKGKKKSNEHVAKIVATRKKNDSFKHTEEWKIMIGNLMKGRFAGQNHPMFGKHPSKETLEKISGKKNHGWLGGISFEPYPSDWKKTLKAIIRERDNYTCQLCGKKQRDLERNFDVHHIDYDKQNCNSENLISLCRTCHSKTNQDRELWKYHFIGMGDFPRAAYLS